MSEPTTSSAASRSAEIAEQLRAQILAGKYEPGERLPSERDLASRLGANRASVREALKTLEQQGMIAIRNRGGARVVPLEDSGLGLLPYLLDADPPDRGLVAQWLDVWELVLAGAARLAVERGTDEEFAQAQRLLDRFLSPTLSNEEFVEVSDEMTELLAKSSRNVVLRMVRNGLTHQLQSRHSLRVELRPPQEAARSILLDAQRALQTRDARAMEEAVRRIIRVGRDRIIDTVAGQAQGH